LHGFGRQQNRTPPNEHPQKQQTKGDLTDLQETDWGQETLTSQRHNKDKEIREKTPRLAPRSIRKKKRRRANKKPQRRIYHDQRPKREPEKSPKFTEEKKGWEVTQRELRPDHLDSKKKKKGAAIWAGYKKAETTQTNNST